MTQLLLFDTPATETFAPLPPVAVEPDTDRGAVESGRLVNDPQHRGVNHMGDLARLVLLRYDLVAQRRARRLAKESAGI